MTNAELKAGIDQVIEALEGIEAALELLLEEQELARERALARELVLGARGVRTSDWPWTPATSSQGFLGGRWLRRDGNVYGGVAPTMGADRANSPIAGGQDNQAKVDVPSGAPRI